MRPVRPMRPLLREVIVPLLCAVMALWGIAQARSQAGKLADPSLIAHLVLCTPASATGNGGDAPPDHDCGNCCLPNPVSPAEGRFAVPLRLATLQAPAPPHEAMASGRIAISLPWSRGPPGVA